MPLRKGRSRAAISANIGRELRAGRPFRQAVAIAMHEAGIKPKAKRRRRGR
jgi:hypothetical protein